jgi:hypothetical protein
VDGPTEVGACRPPVYLLPRFLPYVVFEDGARSGLDGELEGVAQPQSPDRPVAARGRGVEGVVGGDGAGLVYPEHLAEEVGELLRIGRDFVLADDDVELAVLAEV